MNRLSTFALVAGLMLLTACSDESNTERVLSDQGFTDIQTTGYAFFGCGKDDSFHTGFVAKSPIGKTVSGVYCSGWFKGGTIRFD